MRVLEFASAVEPPGPTDTTDLEGATVTALGFLHAGGERRIVLATDGRGTRGSLLRAAERLQTRGVELDAMLPSARPSDDVAVIGLGAPERIELGARFPVDVEVHADGETAAEVALYENGALPDVRHVKSVVLKPGTNRVSFETVSYAPGDLTLEARVAPKGNDRLPGNDRFARVVRIVGKPRVLYVATAPGEERGSVRALEAGGFVVEVRSPDGLPRDTASLRPFDAVLLSNVPRARVRDDQQRPLVAYVYDTGGTLLMAGGAESFGPGGWEGSPVADILPVTLEGERRKDRPSLALALVIDRSGSMTGQKIELAKEAARRTAELLNPDDYIGVVGFDSAPTVIVRMQSARNRLRMDSDIGRVAARGGTNIFPALDLAYRELQLSRAIKKHVILLTDGQSPDRGLRDLAQVMNADGITLTTVG
ncbi:MAG: VWA domain-containing protein, partial [Myxococcales bacterium]|nr:VWA domain-containing protein [Myxococcales bacterium]